MMGRFRTLFLLAVAWACLSATMSTEVLDIAHSQLAGSLTLFHKGVYLP
jgi:hypothetical protein